VLPRPVPKEGGHIRIGGVVVMGVRNRKSDRALAIARLLQDLGVVIQVAVCVDHVVPVVDERVGWCAGRCDPEMMSPVMLQEGAEPLGPGGPNRGPLSHYTTLDMAVRWPRKLPH
jgi:hypothetical protein